MPSLQRTVAAAFLLTGISLSSPLARGTPQVSPGWDPSTSQRWSARPLPPDFTPSTTVRSLGTSLYFQTPSHVYLWSAITLRWVSVPVSSTAVVTQYNAYITIEDGARLHAFATRTGRVETLDLASAPTVYHGPSSSNWLSIAVLGTDAWSFGAFDGRWRHATLHGPVSGMSITSTTGIFSDGVEIYGVSAYYGDLVAAPIPAGAALAMGGDEVVAWTPATAAGFSTHTNTWSTTALTSGTLLTAERGYAMFQDAAGFVAYSPATATFERLAAPPAPSFSAGRYVASVRSGDDLWAYDSAHNAFKPRTFASTPIVMLDDEVLVAKDAVGVSAFSIATGSFSTHQLGSFSVQTNDAMAWIDDGGQGFAFSALEGVWRRFPEALVGAQVNVLRNVVVVATAQAYHAFAGRSAEWIELPTSVPFTYSAPTTGDVFVAIDGTTLNVFDGVVGRWAATSIAAPILASDIWRQTYVGFDGTTAHGFGLRNNAWSDVAVQGTFQALDANSSCGWVLTSTHVYAFSAHGSLSTLSRYPEFSRIQPFGSPLRLIQAGVPGTRVTAIFAREGSYLPQFLGGTLFLDPSSAFLRVSLGVVPSTGVLDVPFDLSTLPGLRGETLHVQTMLKAPGAPMRLANSIAPVIL